MPDERPHALMIWPEESDQPDNWWNVYFEYDLIGGRWEVALIEVSASDQEAMGPLTASVLRSIPFGRLGTNARSGLQRELERAIEWSAKIDEDTAELHRTRWEDTKRPGRRGHPPGHYRDVAGVYANAWLAGEPPTKAVAEKFSVNPATAAKWVSKARKLGFLEPTGRGRAGGIPQEDNE